MYPHMSVTLCDTFGTFSTPANVPVMTLTNIDFFAFSLLNEEYARELDREIDYDADQSSIRSDPGMPRSESSQFPQRPSSRASQASKVQPASTKSYTYRPNSVLNQSSENGGAGSLPTSPKARTGFRLFGKKKKNPNKDFDSDMIGRATSPSPTIDDDDNKTMDFEALMLSGGTMKVTLTPNRLKSIEVDEKSTQQQNMQQSTWRRKKPDIEIIPPPKSDMLKRVALQNLAQNTIKEESTPTTPETNGRYSPKENRAIPPVPNRKNKRWPDTSSVPQVPSSMRNNVITAQHQNSPYSQPPSGINSPASPTFSTFSTRSMRTINSIASLPSESDGDEPNRRDSLLSQSSTLSSLIKSAPAPPATSTLPKVPLDPIRNGSQRSSNSRPDGSKSDTTEPGASVKTEFERPSSPSHNFTTSESRFQQRPSMIIAPRSPRLAKTNTKPRKRSSLVMKSSGDEETNSVASEPVDSEDEEDLSKELPVSAFKLTGHRTMVSSVSMDNAPPVPAKISTRPSKRMSLLQQAGPPAIKEDLVQISTSDILSLRNKMTSTTSVDAAVDLLEIFLTSQGIPYTPRDDKAVPIPAEQVETKREPVTSDNGVQTDPWEPVCEHHDVQASKVDVVTEEKVEVEPMISSPVDYIQAQIAPIVTVTDCDEIDAVERPLDLSEFDVDSSDEYSDIEDMIPMSRFSYPPTYRKAQFMPAKQQVFESEDEEWFLEDSDNESEVPSADEPDALALEEQMTAEWLLG